MNRSSALLDRPPGPLVFGDPPPQAFVVAATLPPEEADSEPSLFEDPGSELDFGLANVPAERFNTNPCVRQLGFGPPGMTCATCVHLYAKQYGKTYWKCALRPDTNGAGSDHRKKWDACAKYEPQRP